jgi:hypothetical protein
MGKQAVSTRPRQEYQAGLGQYRIALVNTLHRYRTRLQQMDMTTLIKVTVGLNSTKLVVVKKVRANAKSRQQCRQTIHNQSSTDEILLPIVGRVFKKHH